MWIVNLQAGRLEGYRNPRSSRYGEPQRLGFGDTVEALLGGSLRVGAWVGVSG